MTKDYCINAKRLWHTLEVFSTFGGTENGGVTRLALSDEDRQGRDKIIQWAKEDGFGCEVDELGNMFICRPGKNPNLAPVLTGSHGDSQPLGGNYDGIYGVLAGLEVLRTLNDHGVQTERDLILVNWTNEEGARFAPAMLASGVWSGAIEKEYALSRSDTNGVTVDQALKAIGYKGKFPSKARPLHACYELHIEQGPILEQESIDIGVVHHAMGQNWYELRIQGFAAHAGTTPMNLRLDALCGFAQFTLAVERIGHRFAPDGRATIGMVQVTPNSRNVVPGEVLCSVELRHPENSALDEMHALLEAAVKALTDRYLKSDLKRLSHYPPVVFDQACVQRIEGAIAERGYTQRPMVSGAGHDACYVQRVAPTAMIFIPCVKGISHNEEEKIYPKWAENGANVLFSTLLKAANEK
ncbi:Zn-dependent hydrolase [Pantoea sp. App145]|uniref:Zn-dependent hydrolase n=1 Tax=Pantoea sp. App145 TaxID=3071567 RepID=UPI003A805654